MNFHTELAELHRNLDSICAKHGTTAVLQQLSTTMLSPSKQRYEFRYLHLLNMLLQIPFRDLQGNETVDLQPIIDSFNRLYRSVFTPQEVDFIYIPFAAWVDWNDCTYRVFSGTFAEPEIYFADQIKKGNSLDALLKDKFGFSFSDLADLILPRIHHYIQASGLSEFETQDCAMSSEELQISYDFASLLTLWEECFVITRSSISAAQLKILNRLSQRIGRYHADIQKLFSEASDIMRFPVVRHSDEFIIACPQLLIPAFLNSVCSELARNHKVEQCLIAHLQSRLRSCLNKKFHDEPAAVLLSPSIESELLSDVAVLFDRKLLLFSAVGSAPARLRRLSENQERNSQNLLQSNPRVIYNDSRSIHIDDGPIEVLHFFVVDSYRELTLGISEDDLPANVVAETLSMKSLEHVLTETTDALHFIKFFRMRKRAQLATQRVLEIGRPILDSFAIFKQKSWLAPYTTGRPTLLVEVHSFGKYNLQELNEYRNKNALAFFDGTTKRFRRHYPNCLQQFHDGKITSLIDLERLRIVLTGNCPADELSFKTWHVSMDSLCYHLGTKSEALNELFQKHFPQVSALEIHMSYDSAGSKPIEVIVSPSGAKLQVELRVSAMIQNFFLAGNNSGERVIVGTLLKDLGMIDDFGFDALIPPSIQRKMQLTAWRPPHGSWNNDSIQAIPLYECDEELTIATEWKSLRRSENKPGLYTAKNDLYSVLAEALKALRDEFNTRIAKLDRNMLATFAYTQLEAAYISSERKKQELAFASHTAEFVNVEDQYIETIRKAVDLTFAIRLVLEAALQQNFEGGFPVTLESFSELAAFANQIMLLDSLGDQIGTLERAGCELPQVELTEHYTIKIHQAGDTKLQLAQYLFESHKKTKASDIDDEFKESFRKDFSETFDSALIEEFGFSLSERMILDGCLMGLFEDREVPIMTINKQTLKDELERKTSLQASTVCAYIERLSLTKELLEEHGEIKPSERYWRDARILNRPIVCIEDEICLFSRTVVGMSSQIFVERLAKARPPSDAIEKNSALAKAIGKWSNDRGEEFKNKLASKLKDLGWSVDCEVRTLTSATMPREGMGPIDIIATDRNKNCCILLEAKQNYFSRNAKDLRNELDYFFGHGQERGEFKRFEEKIEWATQNVSQLMEQYGLQTLDSSQFEKIFVTSEYLYCTAFRTPNFRIMTETEFHDFLRTDETRSSTG